ncbi:MAG: Acyl carrier protein [Frankiales bacterium]|nr:Acyl carrier protein [Frankiales bacterium]
MSPALDETAVLGVVQQAVATVLERDPASVTRATRFREDLLADSLALVEIVEIAEIVEETLAPLAREGFHNRDEDLDGLATVGEAVDDAVARL